MMKHQSGDTLVEVLIAVSILAAAVVGGLGIMNFGFGVILNSIERTQVQANVSSQLSLIQYSRDAYVRANKDGTVAGGPAIWQAILTNATSSYSSDTCTTTGAPQTNASRKPFYIDDTGATYVSGVPGAATTEAARAGTGLWVEAVRPSPATNYIDFYVKACWQPAAGTTNEQSSSVMRLYVP